MAYAIMRWGKIQTVGQAAAATVHSYRQYDISNEGQQALHPNVEFVNMEEQSYWELANKRIAEAGIAPRRQGTVRCVKAIITASSEFFKFDPAGRAVGYSQSDWLKDTRTFLIEKFGEKNLIAFLAHQDEKSPHMHAVIVPITPDGRLSARDLFNPVSIRRYQSEYEEKMRGHGL